MVRFGDADVVVAADARFPADHQCADARDVGLERQGKQIEDQTTPRAKIWEPLLQRTTASGIYFEDYPELAGFHCPEWSHLSAGDSVEFTKRLAPHLRAALKM